MSGTTTPCGNAASSASDEATGGTTPPGKPYVTTSTSMSNEFRATSNGVAVIPDVVGTPGDWTVTIPGSLVSCDHGQPGKLVLQTKVNGKWQTFDEVTVSPC